MLGGGQLGRMFTHAAQALGYKVLVLDPDTLSPAGAVADRHLLAKYEDPEALAELARACAAVTTEFENVPAGALEQLARQIPARPSAQAVRIAQDREQEKTFLADNGFAVAPFRVLNSASDCTGIPPGLLPGIVKTARLGYDGKGQVRVQTEADVANAFRSLRAQPCVLEQRVPLALEISALVGRALLRARPPCGRSRRTGTATAFSMFPSCRPAFRIRSLSRPAPKACASPNVSTI